MSRLLVFIPHSTEDPNRAATAIYTALRLAEGGASVSLWLYGEGVRLGVQHVAEALREPLPVGAAECLERLNAKHAVFHCSKPCFEQRGFELAALRPGARVADPAELAALLAAGAVPLSL